MDGWIGRMKKEGFPFYDIIDLTAFLHDLLTTWRFLDHKRILSFSTL